MRKHVGLAEALDAGAQVKYEQDIAALSSLTPEQAQAEAIKIVRRLGYTSWQYFYGTQRSAKRFDALWHLAFPEDEKGGKKG